MAGAIATLPSQLAAELQIDFLEREFEEGLDSQLAYRRESVMETIPNRIGETLTRTRSGRKSPVTVPMNPASNTALDNGLTPSDASIEQYSFSIQQYGDTVDINLMEELATIADNVIRTARNNGVQAAQSRERICRQKLFNAYAGGNTRVRTDLGAGSSTTCHVDDIRGFTSVLVNGVVTPISSSNPITVNEVAVTNGGVNQVLTVTAATPDAPNASSFAPYLTLVNGSQTLVSDGISGTLTFTAATTPVNGDALIAVNAPKVLRPFSHLTTAQITGSDVLTLGLIEDAVAYLRDNGVPTMDDGTYHMVLDNTSMRQLFADQDFKVLYAGRDMAEEWKKARIFSLLDVTYVATTEAFVQNPKTDVDGGTGGTGASQVPVKVRRPILIGAESIIEGNFEGLDTWLDRQGLATTISDVFLVDNVAQVLRAPLDRLQQWLSQSWVWVGDYAIPTDLTATTAIIPTASNSLFKRSVMLETAG